MPNKRLEDMNVLQKENYYRELALKMMSKNIFGDESVGDNDEIKFQDASISSIQKTNPVNMSEIKKMVIKLKFNLKDIYSMLPNMGVTYGGLSSKKKELFMVYDTSNYKDIQRVGIKAIERYSELKEVLKNLLKSPGKTSEITRNPEVFEKIQNEYRLLKSSQVNLNKIIIPIDPKKDKPGPKKPRNVEIIIADMVDVQRKIAKLKENQLKDLMTAEELKREKELALEGEEDENYRMQLKEDIEYYNGEIEREIEENKVAYEKYIKLMTAFEELQNELDASQKFFEGKGRKKGGLKSINEYIYGRLHWVEGHSYRGEIVYNVLTELKDLGDETENFMKKLEETIYEGTPAYGVGFGRNKSYSYYGAGYYSQFYQDPNFVERKFR